MTWGFVSCGPNQVLVLSGCCHSRPHLIPGGRVFVWPGFQKIQFLTLNTMTVMIESRNVLTNQGIPVNVQSTALVKIVNEKSALKKACSIFIGMMEHEMIDFMRETLEGHQNTVIGKMNVEDSYFKRDKFSDQLLESAKSDLENMGLTILTHKVDQVTESSGIIQDILRVKGVEAQAVIRASQAEDRKESDILSIQKEEAYQLQLHEIRSGHLLNQTDLQLRKLSNDVQVSLEEASSHMRPEVEYVQNRLRLQNELLISKQLEAETRVVQEDTNVIRSLADLVKGALETNAQVQADSSLARAENALTICKAESEAAAIVSQTKDMEAYPVPTPSPPVQVYTMLSGARSWLFGQSQQKPSDADHEEETEQKEANGKPSHKVEDNHYKTCPSSPADLEAGTSAFLCNEHHDTQVEKEIVVDESATESLEKVSSPTSLSHAGQEGRRQEAGRGSDEEAASNSRQESDDHEMMNNDDGGRVDGGDESEEATTMTETWTTMDNEEDDSLGEVTEGLETRADDDDEIEDVVDRVHDKVSQIMGVNLTNAIFSSVFREVFELLK